MVLGTLQPSGMLPLPGVLHSWAHTAAPLSMLLVQGTAGTSALTASVPLLCTIRARAIGMGEDAPCHLYPHIQNPVIWVVEAAACPRHGEVPCAMGLPHHRARLISLFPCRAQRAGGSEYQAQDVVTSIAGGRWGTREGLHRGQGRVLVARSMGLGAPTGLWGAGPSLVRAEWCARGCLG